MRAMSVEQRRVARLAACLAALTPGAMLASDHLHGAGLRVFVAGFTLLAAGLMVYTVRQMRKLRRGTR